MIRLINCTTQEFEEYQDFSAVPEYAILSHRWHEDNKQEVTYQDFKIWGPRRTLGEEYEKVGWKKIRSACEKVKNTTKLDHIWIDSCCIDKTNMPELTEAIMSMYRWYEQSHVCLVYLQDIESTRGADVVESNWFHRGWTLQELIAPSYVLFYNQDWKYCGSRNGHKPGDRYVEKNNFSHAIAKRTNIDKELLRSNDINETRRLLSTIPACQKMSWASDRVTTKEEDTAYCLIGIFGIHHLPLSYGEGCHAFIRLQEEITKQSSDLTLFTWTVKDTKSCSRDNILKPQATEERPDTFFKFDEELHGIFACHPSEFSGCNKIRPIRSTIYNDEIAATSKGLKFTTPISLSGPETDFSVPLYCVDEHGNFIKMYSRWVGGDVFARTRIRTLHRTRRPHIGRPGRDFPIVHQINILSDVHRVERDIGKLQHGAIYLPERFQIDGAGEAEFLWRRDVVPERLWAEEKELFMTYGFRYPVGSAGYERVTKQRGGTYRSTLVFGLDDSQKPWFHMIPPTSALSPRPGEILYNHLDRVWRDAFEMCWGSFGGTFSDVERTCQITIKGTVMDRTMMTEAPNEIHEPVLRVFETKKLLPLMNPQFPVRGQNSTMLTNGTCLSQEGGEPFVVEVSRDVSMGDSEFDP